MSWRVAKSLDVLLTQLNQLAPQRSRLSDGSIGDAAHATRDSDHNPWWGPGIVTARDFTHDPANGLDGQWLADTLVRSRDPRVKYVIWNRRIVSGAGGPSPWVWRPYGGLNAHAHHVHVSVLADPCCDDVTRWMLQDPAPVASLPALTYGLRDDPRVRNLQEFLRRNFPAYAGDLPATGNYLDQTRSVIAEFQRRSGITGPDADGTIVGPRTNVALARWGYRA